MQKKNKNDVFDDFICDLLSTKLDLSTSDLAKSLMTMDNSNIASLPLDQTLFISTAKKQ